jgi:enoyl-[acyl-carrier protein] reductase II
MLLTELLQISYPIIQGGMGNISNAELTAAVSEAGGLGTLGAGTMNADELEKMILSTQKNTAKPFALNLALGVSPCVKDILSLVIKHKVPIISLSAGNPAPFIPKLHEHGVKVISVVASVHQAKKAEAAGTDVIVAEGYEAAGINSPFETTTLTLIPQVVDAVNIPVVAAGGIGDGRGLAAMLILGASGVQMGTRFIATQEAPFHHAYKQNLLNAADTDTVIVGRSVGKIRRILHTTYANRLLDIEKQGTTFEDFQRLTTEEIHKVGAIEGNGEDGFMNGGQISGLINEIPTVAELLANMMEVAKRETQKVSTLL